MAISFSLLYLVSLDQSTNIKVFGELPPCESIVTVPHSLILILQENTQGWLGFSQFTLPKLHDKGSLEKLEQSLWKIERPAREVKCRCALH